MPPRLSILARATCSAASSSTRIPSFLLPFLQYQYRSASILSRLSDNPGAYNKNIRRGRGPSSGKGKTSGRGHKGQKQHGKVPRDFEGGQTPLKIVHGERGFVNVHSSEMVPVNLDKIQSWIDQGRIDPSKPITVKELSMSNCVSNIKDGVKLLGRGSSALRHPIHVVISRASGSAITAIEAAGGSVITRYYTHSSIRRILRGKMDPVNSLRSEITEGWEQRKSGFMYRLPDPTSRKDMEYYRDAAHRGYLSHLVEEGQGPSLFFKKPGTTATTGKGELKKNARVKAALENRVW